jgi:hypothetical protein
MTNDKVHDWRARVAHCGECGRAYETRAPEGVEFTPKGISVDGKGIGLTVAQDAIIRALLRIHGRVVSVNTLLWELSGDEELDEPGWHAIKHHIARLREKLKGTRLSIQNRTGIGFYTIMAAKEEVSGNSNDNQREYSRGVFRECGAVRGDNVVGDGVPGACSPGDDGWEPLLRATSGERPSGERSDDGGRAEPEPQYANGTVGRYLGLTRKAAA